MPLEVLARRPVSQDVPLTPFDLDKTTAVAQDIAAAIPGRRYRLRAYTISSEGNEIVTARILGTFEGTAGRILAHQSTDDQVGMVMVLPGFIELDVNTAIQAELSGSSTNGVLFQIYVEVVPG